MIERLRKRFIRIATLAVAGVLLLLCVTVNAANYVSVDRQLTKMLQMICDNQGTVPHFPPGGGKPGRSPTARSRPRRRIPRAILSCATTATAISSRRT